MVMGNVSGKKDEASPSETKYGEGKEYMECGHGGVHVNYHAHSLFPESMVQSPIQSPRAQYQSPLMFTPQVPIVPSPRPDDMVQTQSNEDVLSEKVIVITWSYDGNEVAVVGSWDNWKRREFLQKSGRDFTIMKVLQSGVYHFRFIVDGQWRYAPDLPREPDEMGNIFNILDLRDHVPEVSNNISGTESPPSPVSSYNSLPFSTEDSNERLPELPPLLQKSPLDQPSSSKDSLESLEKPFAAVLNHLYIQKRCTGKSMVALSSTQRFRTKYVTVVLYKSLKKVKN
ncbi:SNF1-related protein kinase regulatory subunit beta-2-like [Cornus florida]|uniref:SNF1-related protein kinase regulatory subunit beta-2-like n=1 Tax=Cornus florida TaxID=4283 RepID=UPI002896496E|nr:SNF1-related protein kinase regulatory subunit beta-2-like [Cornus florida]